MIRHEFSHSFINPLTDELWNYIKGYFIKFEAIPHIAKETI